MQDTTLIGTLQVPAYADVTLLTTVAGVVVDFATPVQDRVATALGWSVEDYRCEDDLVTFTVFGRNGWSRLDDITASALATVGVTGWIADESGTTCLELIDGVASWSSRDDAPDGTPDAADILFA